MIHCGQRWSRYACGREIIAIAASCLFATSASAQLTDQTQTPNAAGEGIALSLEQQIGVGQGDVNTPDSSIFFIKRDPARAIRRGRQLFQRKFTRAQGKGPRANDGIGDIHAGRTAGLVDLDITIDIGSVADFGPCSLVGLDVTVNLGHYCFQRPTGFDRDVTIYPGLVERTYLAREDNHVIFNLDVARHTVTEDVCLGHRDLTDCRKGCGTQGQETTHVIDPLGENLRNEIVWISRARVQVNYISMQFIIFTLY